VKYRKKQIAFILIILILLLILCSLFVYSYGSYFPSDLCTEGRRKSHGGSDPVSGCRMDVVMVRGEDPFSRNPAYISAPVLFYPAYIDFYDVEETQPDAKCHSNALEIECRMSCIDSENNDFVAGCALVKTMFDVGPGREPETDYFNYYVILEGQEMKDPFYGNLGSRYPFGSVIECDTEDTNLLTGINADRMACKLPYSHEYIEYEEMYPSRCAAVVHELTDINQLAVPGIKESVFWSVEDMDKDKRCCGNNDPEDNGMIYSGKLCFDSALGDEQTNPEDYAYRWVNYDEDFIINTIEADDDNNEYDAVSNSEEWFVCMPGLVDNADADAEGISPNDLPDENKLQPGGYLVHPEDVDSGINLGSGSSLNDIGSSLGGTGSSILDITGHVSYVYNPEYIKCCEEFGDDINDCDCDDDGFTLGENDCDDFPDDDYEVYDREGIAEQINPGRADKCGGDGIDYDCNPGVCIVPAVNYENIKNTPQHLASTFLCDRHDDAGVFVQCCGADLDYCGDVGELQYDKLRIAGSLSTTLKDFDYQEDFSYVGSGSVEGTTIGLSIKAFKQEDDNVVEDLSKNKIAEFRLKNYEVQQTFPYSIVYIEDDENTENNGGGDGGGDTEGVENDETTNNRKFAFPIFIEKKVGVDDFNSDAVIHDFSKYDYLEFFYKTQKNYVLKLRINSPNDQGDLISIDFDVKDYIVSSPGINKWMHVVIPIKQGEQNIKDRFGVDLNNVESLVFLASIKNVIDAHDKYLKINNEEYYNIISFDRISLKYKDETGNNKYCIANKYLEDNSNTERIWINDLDSDKKDNTVDGSSVGQFACVETPSYTWTGTQCCGNDQGLGGNEFYTDTDGGCWLGQIITHGLRIGNVEYEVGEIDSDNPLKKSYVCEDSGVVGNQECFYPVTNKINGNYNIGVVSNDYELYVRKKGLGYELIGGETSTNEDFAMIRASNVPFQITYDTDIGTDIDSVDDDKKKFFICSDDNDFNDFKQLSGLSDDEIVKKDFCSISGDFFCSYSNPPINAPEWSDDAFVSRIWDSGAVIPANQRTETKQIPKKFYLQDEDVDDIDVSGYNDCAGLINNDVLDEDESDKCVTIPKELFEYHFPKNINAGEFGTDTLYEKGCCPKEYCFNGYKCVDGINDQSFTGVGDGTYFARSPDSFSLGQDKWGLKYFEMVGFDQFVCYYDPVSEQADWERTYFKQSFDKQRNGYCLSNDQCWDNECIDPGYWTDDNYCNNGEWISRTKLIAEKLLEIGLRNDNTGDSFAMFCDDYTNTLNYYDYIVPDLASLEGFLGGIGSQVKGVNNFCVLVYPTDEQREVIIGVSLNKKDNELQPTLENFLRIMPGADIGSCEGAPNLGNYFECSTSGATDDSLWFNRKTGSVIYSRYGVLVESGLPAITKFKNWVEHPITTLVKLVKKIFFRFSYDEDAREFELLDSVDDYNSVYLARNKDRNVLGHKEVLSDDTGILTITFENFNTDVCSKLYTNTAYDADCVVNVTDTVSENNPKPVYIVTALKPDNFIMWHDGTSKLRLHDFDFETHGAYEAVINIPGEGQQFDIYSGDDDDKLLLRAAFEINADGFEENVQAYYWDIDADPNSEFVYGTIYGRVEDVNIRDAYGKNAEGYHLIKLIAVGYDGKYKVDKKLICVNDYQGSKEKYDADGDDIPNGCDIDDDADGICDYDYKGEGDGPGGPCDLYNGKIDNCPFVANGPEKGSCLYGVQEIFWGNTCLEDNECVHDTHGLGLCKKSQEFKPCEIDVDEDGINDAEDAFPNDPGASINTDKDGSPDDLHEGWTHDDIYEYDRLRKKTPLVEDIDDDNDGLLDGGLEEDIIFCKTKPDCDEDGLLDGRNVELSIADVDANDYYKKWININDYNIAYEEFDDSGDGVNDHYRFLGEISASTNSNQVDSDNDGIPDVNEIKPGSDFVRETSIFTSDYYLLEYSSIITLPNPNGADSDNDCLWDGDEITGDEIFAKDDYNNEQHKYQTNPINPDSDLNGGDGMSDGWELYHGFDPTDASDGCDDVDNVACDKDRDGMLNKDEFNCFKELKLPCKYDDVFEQGCDPNDADTDDDGYCDGAEDVVGACIAYLGVDDLGNLVPMPDPNPLSGNGPKILVDETEIIPLPIGTNNEVYFRNPNLNLGGISIKIKTNKESDCWYGLIEDDAKNKKNLMPIVQGTSDGKQKQARILLKDGENIVYLYCEDQAGGYPSEIYDFIKINYDKKRINVADRNIFGLLTTAQKEVTITTNRIGKCRIDVSKEKDEDINYLDLGQEMQALDDQGANANPNQGLQHKAQVDFADLIEEQKELCLQEDVVSDKVRLCLSTIGLDDSSCDYILNPDSKESCKELRSLVKVMKGDQNCEGVLHDEGYKSDAQIACEAIVADLDLQDMIFDDCTAQDEFANCKLYYHLGKAVKLSDTIHCDNIDELGINIGGEENNVFTSMSILCRRIIDGNANLCYNDCGYVFNGYHYLVKCEDPINKVVGDSAESLVNDWMENVFITEISFDPGSLS